MATVSDWTKSAKVVVEWLLACIFYIWACYSSCPPSILLTSEFCRLQFRWNASLHYLYCYTCLVLFYYTYLLRFSNTYITI